MTTASTTEATTLKSVPGFLICVDDLPLHVKINSYSEAPVLSSLCAVLLRVLIRWMNLKEDPYCRVFGRTVVSVL